MNGKIKFMTLVTAMLFLTVACISPQIMADVPNYLSTDDYKVVEIGDSYVVKHGDKIYIPELVSKSNAPTNKVNTGGGLTALGLPDVAPGVGETLVYRIFINRNWYYQVRSTVWNHGTVAAMLFETMTLVDGVIRGSWLHAYIPIGSFRWAYSGYIRVPAGNHEITINADWRDILIEPNETDNLIIEQINFPKLPW